jgi:hypothetical protein
METLLSLFKIDLGITHTLRDSFFLELLNSSKEELERKGIELDITRSDDSILVVDFALWNYRKRQEDVELARNIQHRIRNRIVQERIKKQNAIDKT